VLGFLNGH